MANPPPARTADGPVPWRTFWCALLLLSATYFALKLMEHSMGPLGLLLAVWANPVASVAGETYYYAHSGRPTAGRLRTLLCALGMLLPVLLLEWPDLLEWPNLLEVAVSWMFATGCSAFWLAFLDRCRRDD